jgi:hypothetical protein
MKWNDQLVTYLATLGAIVILGLAAALMAQRDAVGSAALSAVVVGLIGAMRAPSQRSVSIDNPPSQPVPTTDTKEPGE